MTPEEFARYDRAEKALLAYPGVVAVGYGLKEVGGEVTDQVAFRVYVEEKKQSVELAPEERIPAEFEGVPTDVLVPRASIDFGTPDRQRHSPLIGGITILNFRKTGTGVEPGTLGCFATATIAGVDPKENVFAITNQHVVAAAGGGVGDEFYQPGWTPDGKVDEDNKGPFGKVHDKGKKEHEAFTLDGDAVERDYFVDCATVRLNICISSWCDTNCGVSYKNAQRETAIDGGSAITGVGQAQANGQTVFKSGATTGFTEATIKEVFGVDPRTGDERNNVIVVESDPADPFSGPGDSGAVLLNEDREIIGLVYGGDTVPATEVYACHIEPVLSVLEVKPIDDSANPPVPPAGKARSDLRGFLDDGADETETLRRRFLATPRGGEIMAAVEAHRGEVVSLVNHRRPVTVAWHRAQGPAFLAHAIENARHPGHRIPQAIEGVDRRALLARMADVLTAHGGSALAAAVAAHRDEVLALAEGCDDLHELVGRFEEARSEEARFEEALADG